LRNFRRIHDGIDILTVLKELRAAAPLWSRNTWRQDNIAVQRETNTIFLRAVNRSVPADRAINDTHECATTKEAENFPYLMSLIHRLAAEQDSTLQRAMIVRLRPYGRVYPHVDEGSYYAMRDRYHLVIVSPGGSELTSGGETAVLREGELWWFDNKRVHSARNFSPTWRTHAIFDLLSRDR
jgi:aspartyl/asparaginyl beta-hydroxylase (cupin superfamily)